MKKFLFILLICLPLITSAQRFRGGIMAGMNVSQIDGDNWAGYNKAGLVAGAFVFTEFQEKWGALMEIRYSAKGSATAPNNPTNRKFRLEYVEIPLMASFEPVNKLTLQFGISYGYLFRASQNDGSGYYEFDELPGKSDLSMCLGINYELFYHLDVNARFSYSVMPIWSDYSGQNYGTGAWFNNVLTFGFYYWIGGRDEQN